MNILIIWRNKGDKILNDIVKKDEIINLNGYGFKCLAKQIELSEIVTKQYLLDLCSENILKEL